MNVAVIGGKGLAKDLGKKGTSSDMTLYNTSFQGKYFTFIEPDRYPEKVQTLFQAINMSQFAIIYIKPDLPKNELGECILAVDMLKAKGVFVLEGVSEEEIRPVLTGTSLDGFPMLKAENAAILDFLAKVELPKVEGKPKVLIDHSFMVRSVGAVALGTVTSGRIKRHDKLKLWPEGKEVCIKSVQIHDKDQESAGCHDRVGVVVKGVEVEDLRRGCIISESMKCTKEFAGKVLKNRFFSEEMPKSVMCVIGLQYLRGDIEGGRIVLQNEVVFDGEPVVILVPDKKIRLAGLMEVG